VNQVERHPYLQSSDLITFCQENGVLVTAYSPLGSPDRPEFSKGKNEPIILQDPVIRAIAEKHNVSPAQVLLHWAIECGTSVLCKTVHPTRMAENLSSVDALTFDEDDKLKIAALDKHRRYITGDFWCTEGSPYTLENLWDQ